MPGINLDNFVVGNGQQTKLYLYHILLPENFK